MPKVAAQQDRMQLNKAHRAAAPHTAHPTAQRNTVPQHIKGKSTTRSNAPRHQAPQTAQNERTARRKRTSTAQRSTAQSGDDREHTT